MSWTSVHGSVIQALLVAAALGSAAVPASTSAAREPNLAAQSLALYLASEKQEGTRQREKRETRPSRQSPTKCPEGGGRVPERSSPFDRLAPLVPLVA